MNDVLIVSMRGDDAAGPRRNTQGDRSGWPGEMNGAEAWHRAGLAAVRRGSPREGIEMMHHALALAPEVAAYPLDLAEVYLAVGELERAIHCSRLALRLEPE